MLFVVLIVLLDDLSRHRRVLLRPFRCLFGCEPQRSWSLGYAHHLPVRLNDLSSLKVTLFDFLSSARFFLGIGIGAEYPTGSVSCSEQTEGKAISKNAQHRWFALATSTYLESRYSRYF